MARSMEQGAQLSRKEKALLLREQIAGAPSGLVTSQQPTAKSRKSRERVVKLKSHNEKMLLQCRAAKCWWCGESEPELSHPSAKFLGDLGRPIRATTKLHLECLGPWKEWETEMAG